MHEQNVSPRDDLVVAMKHAFEDHNVRGRSRVDRNEAVQTIQRVQTEEVPALQFQVSCLPQHIALEEVLAAACVAAHQWTVGRTRRSCV